MQGEGKWNDEKNMEKNKKAKRRKVMDNILTNLDVRHRYASYSNGFETIEEGNAKTRWFFF